MVRSSFGPLSSRGTFAGPPGLDSAVLELPRLDLASLGPPSQNSLKIRELRNPLQSAFFYVVRSSFGPLSSRGTFAVPPGLDSAVLELPRRPRNTAR